MNQDALKKLPGAEIVLPGIADVEAGRTTVNASAVLSARPRLRRAGFALSKREGSVPASHELYRQLQEQAGDGAHSRYNATLARVTSFARAAERARSG